MKKIFTILTACLMLASCAKFTDLKPKGMNMLSTADELELLLNLEIRDFYNYDMYHLTGDLLCGNTNIANLIAQPTPSRLSIIVTWNDAYVKRLAELTKSDDDYTTLFGYVGKVANPILSSVGFASGDPAKIKQIKAEALCLRAWAQFILVNKYAAAYNPATAATTPGIPYLMEDWDISIPPEKWTVQAVYEQIVADCNEAIELDALPVKNINQARWSKACPYAIKALALMAMQRFDDAEAAAKESLKATNAVTDYWSPVYTKVIGGVNQAVNRIPFACEEDIFHTYTQIIFNPLRTPEAEAQLEADHSSLVRIPTDIMMVGTPYGGMGMIMYGLPYPCIGGFGTGAGASWNPYGLKTTHQYLILAECAIRKQKYDEAMGYLDAIRAKRINPDTYAPLKGTVTTKDDAITHLKQTALGENLCSIFNFIERKRWNQLDDMKETLTRSLAGETFTLAPDSPLWIFPFPGNAVDNNPNLKQNSYVEE